MKFLGLSKEKEAPRKKVGLGARAAEQKMLEFKRRRKILIFGILSGLVLSFIFFLITRKLLVSMVVFVLSPVLIFVYFYFLNQLNKYKRVKRMEDVFPDFLQLMASNLRAGITIDRSMLLSVREEFDPLDKEIQKTGKELATGKSMETSLLNMAQRIGSEKIRRTILLIISGMRAGGNLATLLEQTATNMRESSFIEKKAASNVLMYVIFIFVAVAVGAPALFALSTVLVQTLGNLLAGIPEVEASAAVPFTLSQISVSPTFITYFSLIFILVIGVLASLTLGLVNKGEEKEGMKYLLPILIISVVVFFTIKVLLSRVMAGIFV